MSETAAASPARTLAVVTAGVSEPSSSRLLADRLARETTDRLALSGFRAELTTVELRDHAMDITRNLIQGFPSPELEDVVESVTAADGAVFVTPIFSASYSGLFKSFIDILDPDSVAGLPVLIGATAGTERHSLALDFALRPLFTYLRAVVVPTGVFATTSDWGSTGNTVGSGLPARIDRAAAQLAALVEGSDRSREPPQAPPSPTHSRASRDRARIVALGSPVAVSRRSEQGRCLPWTSHS